MRVLTIEYLERTILVSLSLNFLKIILLVNLYRLLTIIIFLSNFAEETLFWICRSLLIKLLDNLRFGILSFIWSYLTIPCILHNVHFSLSLLAPTVLIGFLSIIVLNPYKKILWPFLDFLQRVRSDRRHLFILDWTVIKLKQILGLLTLNILTHHIDILII